MTRRFAEPAEGLNAVQLPTFLNHHNGIDANMSSGAALAKRWMEQMLKSSEAINERRQLVDPEITKGANLRAIENAVAKLETDCDAALKQASLGLKASLSEAKTKLKIAVGATPTSNAPEIRSALRAMPADERNAEMQAAFVANDKEVIGAIVGFPKLTHGCDTSAIAQLYANYQQRSAPNEYRNVKKHVRYAEWLEKGYIEVTKFLARSLKGTNAYEQTRKRVETVIATLGESYDD